MERMLVVEYRREKPGYIALIILTAVLFVGTVIINALPTAGIENDLFKTTLANLSDKYDLDIKPSGWTFNIWLVIYPTQLIWILYAHSLICRQNKFSKGKLYYDPPFLPPTFFSIFCMNLILNCTWLLVNDSEFLVAGFLALLGVYVTTLMCLYFSFRLLWDYEMELSRTEMWLNIILVQNSLGIYATWTSVATLLNLGFVLHYTSNMNIAMETTCYILLVILSAEFLLYYFTDILVATRRLRYFFTPYLVLIVILTGIIDRNWDADSGVQIYVVVLLGVVVLALMGKIASVVYNYMKHPLSIESSD